MKKPGKPKGPKFRTLLIRDDVRAVLDQVEALFQQQTNVKPDHQSILINALQTYKQKLLAASA